MTKWYWAGAVALALVGCRKDPSLKASRSECNEACSHAAALNKGTPDRFGSACPSLCIASEWTVGDVRCMTDATTYDAVKDCAVVAKLLLMEDGANAVQEREERERAAVAAQKAAAEDEAKKAKALADELQKKSDSLRAQIANAKDEATKIALQKQLDDLERAIAATRPPLPPGGGGKKKCTPGDPLCTDL